MKTKSWEEQTAEAIEIKSSLALTWLFSQLEDYTFMTKSPQLIQTINPKQFYKVYTLMIWNTVNQWQVVGVLETPSA